MGLILEGDDDLKTMLETSVRANAKRKYSSVANSDNEIVVRQYGGGSRADRLSKQQPVFVQSARISDIKTRSLILSE